ncbi:MAG TPA: hypothetical protein VGE10_04875 [Zeimonas sp.]
MSATPGPGPIAPGGSEARERRLQRIAHIVMQVLWPAFLMAIIAEGIFFSMIDPRELHVVTAYLQDSRVAAYTVSFFAFWALFACSSGVTYFLAHGIDDPTARSD